MHNGPQKKREKRRWSGLHKIGSVLVLPGPRQAGRIMCNIKSSTDLHRYGLWTWAWSSFTERPAGSWKILWLLLVAYRLWSDHYTSHWPTFALHSGYGAAEEECEQQNHHSGWIFHSPIPIIVGHLVVVPLRALLRLCFGASSNPTKVPYGSSAHGGALQMLSARECCYLVSSSSSGFYYFCNGRRGRESWVFYKLKWKRTGGSPAHGLHKLNMDTTMDLCTSTWWTVVNKKLHKFNCQIGGK